MVWQSGRSHHRRLYAGWKWLIRVTLSGIVDRYIILRFRSLNCQVKCNSVLKKTLELSNEKLRVRRLVPAGCTRYTGLSVPLRCCDPGNTAQPDQILLNRHIHSAFLCRCFLPTPGRYGRPPIPQRKSPPRPGGPAWLRRAESTLHRWQRRRRSKSSSRR